MLAIMIQQLKVLTNDEEGAIAVEYALIAALVALGLIAALTGLATNLTAVMTRIGAALT